MVYGYHIYQSVWDATLDGEVLNCYRKIQYLLQNTYMDVNMHVTITQPKIYLLSTIVFIQICRWFAIFYLLIESS